MEIFKKELSSNLLELQKYGLFFSFTTDPMLPETIDLTKRAISYCNFFKIPVKILTKRTDWMNEDFIRNHYIYRDIMAFGFTLTGHDELEPVASTNQERINAMKILHRAGFKIFASIEPIVDIDSSAKMIRETIGSCDLYKVGLMSGVKYAWQDLRSLIMMCYSVPSKFYFKDSLLKQAGVERTNLSSNCVTRDYNLFGKEV